MVRLMSVCLFAILVVATSCSSRNLGPTEEGLIQRSEMANDALNAQDWAGIYQLYPPEVQDNCSLADFKNGWAANYEEQFGALLEFLGAGTGLTLVVETNSVAITGTNALVTLELDAFTPSGEAVIENLVNNSAQAWKFTDGAWFISEDIPQDFC